MKIHLLRIINFKQFYKEQKAEISDSQDLNVTIFHGVNGAGKTSLFSAMNWCLYGEGLENVGEILNKRILLESDEGKEIPTVVTIFFKHNQRNFIAERVIRFIKQNGMAVKNKQYFTLSIIERNGITSMFDNPIGQMNSILPENVREYFFFDGEKMEDLTRPDNGKIEKAIQNIMRLPIIDKTLVHLDSVADDFRKELKKKGSSQLEYLISEEERCEILLNHNKDEKEQLNNEIRRGKQQILDLEKVLRENQESKTLQIKRDMLTEHMKEKEVIRKNLIIQISDNSKFAYCKFLEAPSKIALLLSNQLREKGEIPSGIREQFIQDLLDKGICICGRVIENDKASGNHLRSLLEKSPGKKLEDSIINIPGEIRLLSTKANDNLTNLERDCKSLIETEESLEKIERELDDINRELSNFNDVDISSIEIKIELFRKNQLLNQYSLGKVENEIESILSQIEKIVNKREIEEKKLDELKLLSKKEELARKSYEAVAKIKEDFYENTRLQIESETKKVFFDLAWKQDHFQDIRLDPDFHLEVLDRWGGPSREELSAGERQILSLSFLAAMAGLSGEESPVIMDTPFGRLSGNHLQTVASNLPKLLPQLILFVTDREWDDSSKSGLEPHVGFHYNLNFDKDTGCSSIEEVHYD